MFIKLFPGLKYPLISLIVRADGRKSFSENTIRSVKRSDYRGDVETILFDDKKDLKKIKGRILVFFDDGCLLGKDLLSGVADAADRGILAGTCYVKPKKKRFFLLLKYGLRNLFNSKRNVDKLFFCSKEFYDKEKSLEMLALKPRSLKRFKVVKGFVSV